MKSIDLQKLKRCFVYLGLASLIILIDQLTKRLIFSCDSECQISGFLKFQVERNYGFALSLFSKLGQASQILFVVLAAIALIFVLAILITKVFVRNRPAPGEVLILAGGLSNLIDRFVYGFVVDFIKITTFGFNWSPMNIADIAIFSGVFWVIYMEKHN